MVCRPKSLFKYLVGGGALFLPGLFLLAAAPQPAWPVAVPAPSTENHALIRAQPVCIFASDQFAGQLGETLAYRHRRHGDQLVVSYFAYWSSERPWGGESLMAALLIDAFYSRWLYVLPGPQRVLYGPGDVEGVTVTYRAVDVASGTSHLEPVGGVADNAAHHPALLDAGDLRGRRGETCLLTMDWSHQLGAPGAAEWAAAQGQSAAASSVQRCYVGDALVPLTDETAAAFRLGDAKRPLRALPAWL